MIKITPKQSKLTNKEIILIDSFEIILIIAGLFIEFYFELHYYAYFLIAFYLLVAQKILLSDDKNDN
jgi:hypothetical protein